MTYIIGIDPGKSGATAVIDGKSKELIEWWDYEGAHTQSLNLNSWKSRYRLSEIACNLEKVNAFPGQGVTSVWSFGQNYGEHQGILTALQIPYALVTPQMWQKKVLQGLPRGNKGVAREFVQRLYPTLKARKASGVWDAICIALYGVN